MSLFSENMELVAGGLEIVAVMLGLGIVILLAGIFEKESQNGK